MQAGTPLVRWNQFILGQAFADSLLDWNKTRIGDSWCLSSHPNLSVCQQTQGRKQLTMLGFMLDPESPNATDADIVFALLGKTEVFHSLLGATSILGGRWILIFCDGKSIKLFHDACGSRQVFYTDGAAHVSRWCASQPELIANLLQLRVDPDANDFFQLQLYCQDREAWWPGISSPFQEVRHLLPSHYLDLDAGAAVRYWPEHKLPFVSLDEGVKTAAALLRGMMEAATKRFDLCVGITAGFDSRCILAASRDVANHISFYTGEDIALPWGNARDIKVASALLERLDLRHNIVKNAKTINSHFFDCYKQSVMYYHVVWYPGSQGLLDFYHKTRVEASGHASAIGRCYYGDLTLGDIVDGEYLAGKTGMGWHPFAVQNFQRWLDDLGDPKGISTLDLFYWENRVGNWMAMAQAECETALKDTFTPFNCRKLLTLMLSIDVAYRRSPRYPFHRELIHSLWPETLLEPINPGPTSWNKLTNSVKRRLFDSIERFRPRWPN
jgi:hypothetical protein